MSPSRVEIEIVAPAPRVWALLTELRHWPEWGPSVRDAETSTGASRIALGTSGRVRTALGFWLPFEITAFEPERFWDWRVAGVQATGHFVEPLGPAACRVAFSVPRWAPPYRIVCRRGLARLKGLAEGARGGREGSTPAA